MRRIAVAITVAAVAGLGAVFSYTPRDSRAEHVREMKLREIAERFAQGTVMLHAKRYDYALAAFHRVLELDPALPEAHVNAGFALLGLARHAEARAFFESAIALRRDQINAYYGLALALDALGETAAARGAMRTYVHLAPPEDPYRRKGEAALWEWQALKADASPPARRESARR